MFDPTMAGDELWAQLHAHFTEPALVELGYFIGFTYGGQRWIRTLGVKHGEVLPGNRAGLAPKPVEARP